MIVSREEFLEALNEAGLTKHEEATRASGNTKVVYTLGLNTRNHSDRSKPFIWVAIYAESVYFGVHGGEYYAKSAEDTSHLGGWMIDQEIYVDSTLNYAEHLRALSRFVRVYEERVQDIEEGRVKTLRDARGNWIE